MESQKNYFWNITRIPESEIMARRAKVLKKLEEERCDAMVCFAAASNKYLTGAALSDFERPMVLVLKADGSTAMFLPLLEYDHAQQVMCRIDKFVSYTECPGPTHPMLLLADLLKELGLANKRVAADMDGYGPVCGYTGPKLTAVCPQMELVLLPRLIESLKIIKTDYDMQVIRELTRWSNLAHTLLQKYTKPGLTEMEVRLKVESEATLAMLNGLGPDFVPGGDIINSADYRGQVGEWSCFGHALFRNATFKVGDILGSRACTKFIGMGYYTELERCMFIGEPTKEMETYFNHICAMQEIAFNTIRPGIKCSDVDKEVRRYYEENNLMPYWRHHTGHALGLGVHERPFFDTNDDTIIEKGMVFSVEPGLYVRGLGGFRHSDTIHVIDGGIERITYYPRDLERLIIWP